MTKTTFAMTRRLASTASATASISTPLPTSSSVPDAAAKVQSLRRWDDTQHPMNYHPNFKAYSQAQTINGIPLSSIPSSTSYIPSTIPGTPAPLAVPPSTSHIPSTIPGTPAPLAIQPSKKCQLPSAHTMVSVGGILTKIPSRMVKKTETEALSTSPSASTTSSVPNASPEAASPYRWDEAQHPMHSHPNFKTYRQAAMMKDIKSSTVPYTPKTIPGTPAPIKSQLEEVHTIISIGGILTKIPPRTAKMAETKAQALTSNVLPTAQSLINRGILKWERDHERRKEGKEEECWSDNEDWVGLQSGLAMEYKNEPLPGRAEGETEPMRECYENNEDSIGFQSSSHQRPVLSINDKTTPKSNGWALGQDIDADESCVAVSPDVILATVGEGPYPVPPEGTMEQYGRLLHSMPGDENRKAGLLMEGLEDMIPESIREDRWYLAAIGALVGTQQSELVADLYTYIIAKPQYQTSSQRQQLVRRMRESLLKLIPIVGMPLITRAYKAMVAVEAPCDHDSSASWTSKRLTPERLERARVSMANFLAAEQLQTMYEGFGSHQDLAWVTENIVYGLFFSDTTILDETETQLVVLPALLCTERKLLAEAHMAGGLRHGFKAEEVEGVHAVCEILAGWLSVQRRGWERS